MKCAALLVQFALIAQAHATVETTSPEDEEAMNQLIDTLVDDDKNDELVDMISQKLVDKLLGFEIASLSQNVQAMQMRPPVAEVRQMARTPSELAVAPQVNVAYDDSKLTRLGKNIVVTEKRDFSGGTKRNTKLWGNKYKLKDVKQVIGDPGSGGAGINPYGSVAYPTIEARSQGPADKTRVAGFEKDWKGYGVEGVRAANKPSDKFMKSINREDYIAGDASQRANGALGLSGTAQELAKERADTKLNGVGLMEEDSVEEPDAITILAVGICSAFVGSATTFALFHLHRSFTKTEMQAPLLN